ncbi:xylulokinase [Cohnella caldifontis]|uniref:xylulokinase n=1 Tax=Cohnella caldifontis TaxID=3027471 RepID=UPI0023ED8051|nr:FGGY family carbohydrate kinase [Cohnella sp. YIM B05605]
MKYIASFDIGTTNVKGMLVTSDAGIFLEKNVELKVLRYGDFVEQEPEQWYDAVKQIAASWFKVGIKPSDIGVLTFSGQMQDCIPVGDDLRPLRPAILYADGRATEQSARLIAELGEDRIHERTENHMDGSLTFPKILWLKEREEETFRAAKSFLVSSKDYVVARLTGACATDPTSAATTGCMDARTRAWVNAWLDRSCVTADKMPAIVPSDQVVGTIHAEGAAETGFAPGTPVLCGIGDAGAATLGAGVYEDGEIYAYLGTTGWVASATSGYIDVRSGAFNLAYVEEGRQIAIAPLSNAGNAHQWAVSTFGGGRADLLSYKQFDRSVEQTERGTDDVLFLPYLNGERCPVQDANASGCFIGLKPTTTKERMGTAVLEGVAYSMRQLLELVAGRPSDASLRVTLIGGGAKSKSWCRILADALGCEIAVPEDSQYLPSLGAAALGFRHAGWSGDFAAICRKYKGLGTVETFAPDEALRAYYDRQYGKFKKIYPAVAPLFAE